MPSLTIGLPVFNGAAYLEQSLQSLLAQSYGDFELVISDNSSTDATEEICRSYGRKDARIRYYRADRNHGAAWNFNRVTEEANSEFFKWAAYDDLHEPRFLETCIHALRESPRAVLSYTRSRLIDEEGKTIRDYRVEFCSHSDFAHERFYDLISRDYLACQLYGVMRTASLKRTPLLGSYPSADINLLAELALMGTFSEIPEYYFMRRDHARRSVRAFPGLGATAAWFDPGSKASPAKTKAKRFLEYYASIRRSPLRPAEKLRCYLALGKCLGARMAVVARNLGKQGATRG